MKAKVRAIVVQMLYWCKKRKPFNLLKGLSLLTWSHLGSNQGPPDYESGALTNWAIGPNLAANLILILKLYKKFILLK